jgi:hypothetical protein
MDRPAWVSREADQITSASDPVSGLARATMSQGAAARSRVVNDCLGEGALAWRRVKTH